MGEVKNEAIYQYVTFPIYENSSGTTKTLASMFSIPMQIKSIQKQNKKGVGGGGGLSEEIVRPQIFFGAGGKQNRLAPPTNGYTYQDLPGVVRYLHT